MTSQIRTRAVVVLGTAILCVIVLFHKQIGNGFTLLSSDTYRYDTLIQVSILEHWYAVFRGWDPWRDAKYFFPYADSLGYDEGFFLFGVIYAAFRALGGDPFLSCELVSVVVRIIGFCAFYLAARRMLKLSFRWSLLAAAIFTLSNNVAVQAYHAQLLSVAFIPVMALLLFNAFGALERCDRWAVFGWGAACALFFAAWLMTAFYIAWFFVFFTVAFLAVLAVRIDRPFLALAARLLRANFLPLLGVAAVLAAAAFPFVSVYLPKAAETGMHDFETALGFTPSVLDMVDVGNDNAVWGHLVLAVNTALRPSLWFSERTTGMPLGLVLLFLFALVWLCRRDRDGFGRPWILAPLAAAALITWVLALHFREWTGWIFVYRYFPGAKAIRVVSRYQLFLTAPVVAVAVAALAAHARRLGPAVLVLVCTLLVVEELNSYTPTMLDRPAEQARLAALPAPPAACHAFYLSHPYPPGGGLTAPEDVEGMYSHNVYAMLVSEVLHLPTVNGFSTFNPPDWDLGYSERADYRQRVAAYAEAHGLQGLCELNLQAGRWQGPLVLAGQTPWDGSRLDFSAADSQTRYRASNLYNLEDWGRWTRGTHADLRLDYGGAPGPEPLALHLTGRSLVRKTEPQTLTLAVQGKPVCSRVLTESGPVDLRCALPGGLAQGKVTISVMTSYAMTPLELGIRDQRALGFGLVTLALERGGAQQRGDKTIIGSHIGR